MQVKKLYVAEAFGFRGMIEVVSILEGTDSSIYYVKQGEFLAKTWGNDHESITILHGQKVLGISSTNFKILRELSLLEQELY